MELLAELRSLESEGFIDKDSDNYNKLVDLLVFRSGAIDLDLIKADFYDVNIKPKK